METPETKMNTSKPPKEKQTGTMKTMDPTVKKTLSKTEVREKLIRDVKQIMKFSNVTPIWVFGHEGYQCAYCEDAFLEPSKLKKHTQEEHDNVNEARFFILNLFEYIFKFDVTGLKCGCCNEDLDSLESLINHLNFRHKKRINDDIKDIILPFRFDTEGLRCVVCFKDCHNFGLLQEHMITHCDKKFVCEICGASFMWNSALKTHLKEHSETCFKCRSCFKKFTTVRLRDEHAKDCTEEKIICDYCPESFANRLKKNRHMSREHGSGENSFACNICNKYFPENYRLTVHVREVHMSEKYECDYCGKKFASRSSLWRHHGLHRGEKKFECPYCSKVFSARHNMIVHTRIHTNERPFNCEVCGSGFVQKASMLAHMKTRHGVIA